MNRPTLVISLDFELHWGRFDKAPLQACEAYYQTTRRIVPHLLAMFEKYKVEVTWATVGMLMADGPEEWLKYSPEIKPNYKNSNLSAYNWFKATKATKDALFAPELVKAILETPGQELASHTFSHYYTMENGQENLAFPADLMAAQKIAYEKFGKKLSSLVFPRNQFNAEAIQVASELGFTSVRTNPVDWFWKTPEKGELLKKIWRTSDAIFSLGKKTSYQLGEKKIHEPILIPASRFLRPFQAKLGRLNQMKVNRIIEEINTAAINNEVYHIWWHPHNHGNFPEESLREVEQILKHFAYCREKYNMQSKSMDSLSQALVPVQ
ncbi:polysaccharide deacetylase family protein [Cyclobacterium marinum]|uniref:Polysaccharide deacetylase n=1 Tax=Cyclobacterium marinum (strain ATCC 25205 / DSM 745 / LMG 13164 / NCIMB 1802) TaxID=880070 RepID=G0J2U2_CYCMS|nr:polysaccharide deacetylase family protein [Cyclobacterium marinum]AEL27429.1 polysaccharide deacetylase [Cyclobacterium marinum DSM 745]|tara:strand:+ start:329 stop:1297 length:969 start_codon:yes stop_codon:yes gene_type:complete